MAKQFTGNAKSFGHIHPLMKRTDWNEYKRNYDQDKIQYSQWAKGGSAPNASKLQSAISTIYNKQARQAKTEYYKKFSGLKNPEDSATVIAQLDALETLVTENYFTKAATQALKSIKDDRSAMGKLVSSAIKVLQNGDISSTSAEYNNAISELESAAKILNDLLYTTIPAELGMDLTAAKGNEQQIAEALYRSTMDSKALTSYLNSARLLESLDKVVKDRQVGENGLVFYKYMSPKSSGIIKKTLDTNETLGDLSNIYRKTDAAKVIKTQQTITNTIAQLSGSFFEGAFPKMLAQAMSDELIAVEEAAKSVQGAVTDSSGRQQKTDVVVKINTSSVKLKEGFKTTDLEFPTLDNGMVQTNLSLKQGSIKKQTNFQNSTFKSLLEELGSAGGVRYQNLLVHYFQLYNTEGAAADENVMKLVNAYVVSHMASKIIGDDIDFIVYSDGAISKHMMLQKLGNGKYLRIFPRGIDNLFDDIASAKIDIKN